MSSQNPKIEESPLEKGLNGSSVVSGGAPTQRVAAEPEKKKFFDGELTKQLPEMIENFDFEATVEPLRETIRENPLRSLGIGLGVGFLLGKLLR
jgi:hypothetical protein